MFKKIRPNVLILVGLGYIAVLIIFVAMVWKISHTSDAETLKNVIATAYDVVKGPLMALIGGSLAISKDLIDDPEPPSPTAGNGAPTGINDKSQNQQQ